MTDTQTTQTPQPETITISRQYFKQRMGEEIVKAWLDGALHILEADLVVKFSFLTLMFISCFDRSVGEKFKELMVREGHVPTGQALSDLLTVEE